MKSINRELWLLIILSGIILISTCGIYYPMESSDARYLEIARKMYLTGDYIHPNLLNIHHYHKPPITYIVTALGYEIFGINPFGGRFFLQISILIEIYLVYQLANIILNSKKSAIYSAYIFSSFILVLSASRSLTTDSFLSLFALSSIIFWLIYDRDREKYIYLYLFVLSLALGFLTKGPVVFIVPFTFIAIYRYFYKKDRRYRREHIFATILFILVGGSWYFYLIYQNHTFLDYFTLKQTVERFASRAFHRDEPFYYYWLLTPLMGLPWLGVLPYLLKKSSLQKIDKVLIITILLVMIFFSLAHSKRILYILPLMPLFAILVAHLLEQIKESDRFIQKFIIGYISILFIVMYIAPLTSKIFMPEWIYYILILATILISRLLDNIKSLIIASLITNFTLLGYFSIFARYNPEMVHSEAIIIADWLKENNLDKRVVLVYEKRLPSLAFDLNRDIVSIYYKSPDLNREVLFESSNKYKKYYYNINQKDDLLRLKEFLDKNSYILITKRRYPHSHRRWLVKGMTKESIGKWDIYIK